MERPGPGVAPAGLVRGAVRRADELLLRMRDSMTPGQRWTSALALVLVILVIQFGAPTRTLVSRGDPSQGGAGSSTVGSRVAPTTNRSPTVSDPSSTVGSSVARGYPGAGGPNVPDPSGGTAGGRASPAVRSSPRAIALVPPADDAAATTGRSEADVARVFVGEASYPFALTEVSPDDQEICEAIAGPRNVAVASTSLVAAFRDCLVRAGIMVIAFDPAGDRPPTDGRQGQVLSTRRGTTDTLLDMASWGSSGPLDGRVGIVTTERRRTAVDAAAEGLRAMGIDVRATVYLEGSDAPSSDGVRSFVEKGIEVVLFAAPVKQQRRWAAQHTILDPAVRFVVSDVSDGVREETYPPSFDGALAHTSLRMPWFSREHGETTEQTDCRERWEAGATPPTTLGARELGWVYQWCQHVRLLGEAAGAADETPVGSRLRTVRLTSPLTSDLGPLGDDDGRYGPTEDAVLVWRASCSCWEEQRGFRPRGGS